MSIDQSPLGQIAQSIVEKRYFRKDKDCKPTEDWRGLVNRVVNHVCSAEPQSYKDKIFDLIHTTKFLPNSPCLVNAGTPVGGLLACFVTKSPEDSWVGMMENLANFGHIARRGGGCFHESHLVSTENGPKCIKDIKNGDKVWSYDFNTKETSLQTVVEVHENYTKSDNILTLRIGSNSSIICSDYHPFFVLADNKIEEKEAKDIKPGDCLIMSTQAATTEDFDPKFHLYGLILADGHISTKQKRLRISGDCREVIESAVKTMNTFFGLPEYKISEHLDDRGVYETICCHSEFIRQMCSLLKVDGAKTYTCRVPDFIWLATKSQKLSFISGLIDGDGYVSPEGKLFIYTASQSMQQSLQQLLGELGFRTSCRIRKSNKSPNIGFEIRIFGNTKIFNLKHPSKAARIQNSSTIDYVYIPKRLAHKISQTNSGKVKRMAYSWTNRDDNYSTIKVERRKIKALLQMLDGEIQSELKNLAETTCVRVTSINKSGLESQILYDLTVTKNSNYFVSGGGSFVLAHNCGVDFSNIRPEGDMVFGSTHAKACGPIRHMIVVSEAMNSITQAGFRGMANMGVLRVDHPDIEKFIVCKQRQYALKYLLKEDLFNHYSDLQSENGSLLTHEHANILLDKFISNFNISVLVTDEFMRAVEKDTDFDLTFKGKVYKTIRAKELFQKIVTNAWKNGDPGLLFYNAINDGPYKWSGQELTATNPCGEQMLPQFGSCNLGSIDVSKFYDAKNDDVDWYSLKTAIEVSFQFLDDVIDINVFPTPDFEAWAKNNRPVGLGIMGWADLLLKLKIRYGSEDSIEMADKLGKFFNDVSHKKSVQLGKQKGTPKCCQYKELEFRRNATTLSIAPTGSISLIAGCASSIEPVFAPITYRYDNTGQYTMPHPDSSKPYFRCAVDKESKGKREVTWQEHVDMQAVFQKHVDSGISKTINMPNDSTEEDIANAYTRSWKNKCKGITIYRDGCKTTQVLNTDRKPFSQNSTQRRPQSVNCDIYKTVANGKDWHIIVGIVNDAPYEIFAVNGRVELPNKGVVVKKKKKHYSLLSENNEVLIENLNDEEELINDKLGLETRRFSLELRHGIHPKFIVQQIDKSNESLVSFSKAVSRIIKKHYLSDDDCVAIASDVSCPSCAGSGTMTEMISESGCWRCPVCNYSKCG